MEEHICQSCGMTMAAIQHFGTNKDHSLNKDYCSYCYQNGEFTEESTAYSYLKPVNQVVDYIQSNLQEKIELTTLANLANISHFHFHRIFKSVMNENVGEYVQRVRLERAAFKLQTTNMNLTEIAEQVGYQTQFALSKAFKKAFNISPSTYRNMPTDLTIPVRREECGISDIRHDIRVIEPVEVVYIQVANPYKYIDAFTKAWDRLLKYVRKGGIPDGETEYFTFSRDVPTIITSPEQQRIFVCVNNSDHLEPSGTIGVQTIEGGEYAVFTMYGAYRQLPDVYTYIYRYWLFNSDYQIRDSMVFEKYLNSPDEVEEDKLMTEIYIPVSKK